MGKTVARDEIRLRFISISKQALEVGAASARTECPLAQTGRLEAFVARSELRIDQALQLRFRELEDALGPQSDDALLFERDEHDDYCQHLVVVDRVVDRVVGSCRLLTPLAAQRCGRYSLESTFDLSGVRPLRGQLLELGHVCVEASDSSGAVLMLLWSAVGQVMTAGRFQYLIGTANLSVQEGLESIAALHEELARVGLQSDAWRIEPRQRLPARRFAAARVVRPHGLLRAYLKGGARLLGAPGYNPLFDHAEFPMLLDLGVAGLRAARRFVPAH